MMTDFAGDVRAAGLPAPPTSGELIRDQDVESLPDSAQRYLRFMRIVGRPRDHSFLMSWEGQFRRSPTARWMDCEAWQYNTGAEIARIFRMSLRMNPFSTITVRDRYVRARGHMQARLMGQFTIMDATGPELDLGELVTWLNDAVMFAPSMLLRPTVGWRQVDNDSFELRMTDGGLAVAATVFLNSEGAPLVFATTDRFLQDPDVDNGPWVRTRWTTPIDGWELVEGRPRPTGARAVWHPPQGDFCYAKIHMASARLTYNVAFKD